jgi:hypothetical protein
MTNNRFWPLDLDPEEAIYDNPSWDLPGFRSHAHKPAPPQQRPAARKKR